MRAEEDQRPRDERKESHPPLRWSLHPAWVRAGMYAAGRLPLPRWASIVLRETPPTAARLAAEQPASPRGLGLGLGLGLALGSSPSTRTAGLVASAPGPAQSQVEAFRQTEGAEGGRTSPGSAVDEGGGALRGGASASEPDTVGGGDPPMEQQAGGAGGVGGWAVAALQAGVQAHVVVRRPQLLQEKMEAMRRAGPTKIQVIADFDRTLTKYRVNGERGQSSHALVEQDDPQFNAKRDELFEHYFPLETDPTIPFDDKFKLMDEWWSKSHDLMIQGGLTLDMISKSVAKANTQLREGALPLFQLLEKENIPLLIFSAGLGDVIEEILRQRLARSFRNVRVVSNRMEFNGTGQLVGFQGRIIHVLNKNEHALEMAAPLHERPGGAAVVAESVGECVAEIRRHTHVILLGDHMGDLGMSEGTPLDTQISIGFLNDDVERQLDTYSEAWDVVILDDGSLDVASNLVHAILDPKN